MSLMVNLQREIVWVVVGFHKILTGYLLSIFNVFDDFP